MIQLERSLSRIAPHPSEAYNVLTTQTEGSSAMNNTSQQLLSMWSPFLPSLRTQAAFGSASELTAHARTAVAMMLTAMAGFASRERFSSEQGHVDNADAFSLVVFTLATRTPPDEVCRFEYARR